MTIWLSGDHHFDHTSIIRFCDRPFDTVGEMNEELVGRWNDVVSKDDEVVYLGDFSLATFPLFVEPILLRLNGHIRMLTYPFHHDRRWLRTPLSGRVVFSASGPVVFEPPIIVLEEAGFPRVVCCHFPFAEWPGKHRNAGYSVHAHAHSHGNYKGEGRIVDVGVDCHDYYPVSLERVVHLAKTNAGK